MLSSDVKLACEAVVNQKLKDAESFTAYDVTQALRDDGHWAKHTDVKEEVHSLMDAEIRTGRKYRKESQKVTSTVRAYMYIPEVGTDNEDDDITNISTLIDNLEDDDD